MTCGKCGATIAQVSGKFGGYYGCLGAAKGACENKLLVRRKLTEEMILEMVRDRITSAEAIHRVLEGVETEVKRIYADTPETIRVKEAELAAEERRLANFVDFVGEGRGSQALAKAPSETERRVDALRAELHGLTRSHDKIFQAPPVEWIKERMTRLQEVLERRTEVSAVVLRKVLGPIRLEPMQGDIGRPYYKAQTSLDTLGLIHAPLDAKDAEPGSNSLRWWTRTQRIRTVAALPIQTALVETSPPPIYQRIAQKASYLRELGLSWFAIARQLGVNDKTVVKALRWLQKV